MSIFKTKWIVLKIHKIKPWEFLYTIFTKDYWKIICNKKISKKEKTIDLWYLINFEITTKENTSIHKIRHIKILSEYNTQNKSFSEINTYLELLSIVHNKIPKWSPIYEVFNLLEIITIDKNINETKLVLAKFKVISIFWELNENENDNNITISKILKFINCNKINKILLLTWINEDLLKILKNIN